MAKITENQMKQTIKNNSFESLYFLYGDESYLTAFYTNKIVQTLVPAGMEGFALHEYTNEDTEIDDIAEAVETLPMMTPYNCVVVCDFPLDKLVAVDTEKLVELISDIPETTVLVFAFPNVEVDGRRSAKWRKLIASFTKFGGVLELNRMGLPELTRLLAKRAKREGKKLDRETANYFVEIVGNDIQTLLSELDKLLFYADGDSITKNDINEISTKSLDATVFDLVRAISRRNSTKAFEQLQFLTSQKVEPVMILGTIIGNYVDMYRVKSAQHHGKPPQDVANHFMYRGREFRLGNAAREAKNISIKALRKCLDVLVKTDEKLKFTNIDNTFALQECIVKLLHITSESV